MPLYQGEPSQEILSSLASEECDVVLKDLVQKNSIQCVPGASVIVRIADGRRDAELGAHIRTDINQSYLPTDNIDSYNIERSGPRISDLLPQGSHGEDIRRDVTRWFRKLLFDAPNGTTNHGSSQMKVAGNQEQEESSLTPRNGFQALQQAATHFGASDPSTLLPFTSQRAAYSTARQGESQVSVPRGL